MKKILFLIVLILIPVQVVVASDIKLVPEPTPLEKHERQQAFKDVESLANEALVVLNRISDREKNNCIKAIGDSVFCGCITQNLPSIVSFVEYVNIVSQTKEELKYDKLPTEDKKLVDNTRKARDKCVKEK